MEQQLIESVGKIAGLSGIAVVIGYLLFRRMISPDVFKALKKGEPLRYLNGITTGLLVIALVAIGAATFTSYKEIAVQSTPTGTVDAGNDIRTKRISVEQGTSSSNQHTAIRAGHDINVDEIIVKAKEK